VAEAKEDRGGSLIYVCLLTAVAALGGLLFGYDTAVISGAIGFLQLHFDLDPQLWKGWAAACALIGCAAGAGSAGLLSDRFGRKKVLLVAAVLFLASALGTAFPPNFGWFVVFRIVGGLGVGAASITSPMYIAEVTPALIRGRMVSVNQFAIVSGILVVYFVNYFVAGYGTAVDQPIVDSYVRQFGPAVDTRLVKELADRHYARIEPRALEEFLAKHGSSTDSQAVALFLAEHGVRLDKLDVHLANQGILSWNQRRGWRWMFGSGALPALVLLLLLFRVPESPRWLTKHQRRQEALAIFSRVGGPEHAAKELAEIEHTVAQESGSLAQLLLPGMRVALMIGVVLAVLQQVTGINVFLYFAPEIFKSLGSEVDAALWQTILVGSVNMSFTVIAIWTVDHLGRKPLMLIGYTGMGLSLAAIGLASYWQRVEVWVLTFILSYIACFALSVGPVTWVILSEIFPTKIRGRAMAIATVCLWGANYVVTQTFTIMDEDQWLKQTFHRAFPFWIYALLCLVAVLFTWRLVPETKGKTLEEIERSWTR
jgi:SP family xylose:H+ symportor-like MFS transporter